jgi:hypothetical protein
MNNVSCREAFDGVNGPVTAVSAFSTSIQFFQLQCLVLCVQCLIHGHMEADPEAIYNLCLILKIMF